MLFVWDAQLARECARIVTKRARFCDRLKALAADAHKRLTDGKENLEISYVTQIEGENAEEREKSAALLLSGSVEKDFDLGYTTSGCQRETSNSVSTARIYAVSALRDSSARLHFLSSLPSWKFSRSLPETIPCCCSTTC